MGVSSLCLAHKGGHHHAETAQQQFTLNSGEAFTGHIITVKDGKAYIETDEGNIRTEWISNFSLHDVKELFAYQKKVEIINLRHEETGQKDAQKSTLIYLMLLIAALLAGCYIIYKRYAYKKVAVVGLVTCLSFMMWACGSDDTSDSISLSSIIPANNVSVLTALFEQFDGVTTSSDDDYFYISSDGVPNHEMMTGITAWNEQVPLSQGYTGSNSWAIPLQPKFSDTPLSTESNFFKGAIAIAVNGIPIFNPLNNRGEDTNTIGELDKWGGHSGRADDYHYHVPPTHLQSTVGSDAPIAYALDGFPVYGETTATLDEYLGVQNEDGSYQYHVIDSYPYFISSMRGEVTLDPSTTAPENQILPQAFTQPVRDDLSQQPQTVLITGFEKNDTNDYSMTYTKSGDTYTINYSWDENELYTFEYVDPDGSSTIKTYQRK